jgi:hypothetical protein
VNATQHGTDIALVVLVTTAPLCLVLLIAFLRGYTVEIRARFARDRRRRDDDP